MQAPQTIRVPRWLLLPTLMASILVRSVTAAPATGSPPTPSAETVLGALCAAIEGVSKGSVRVEEVRAGEDGSEHNTYVVTFDDGKGYLRCEYEGVSGNSTYVRTTKESLFCQARQGQARTIVRGTPDRDLRTSYSQPLDPHSLWYADVGIYLGKLSYTETKKKWFGGANKPESITFGEQERITLTWVHSDSKNKADTIYRLAVDPALDFVPVRSEWAVRDHDSKKETISSISDIQWVRRHDVAVPVAVNMRGPGKLVISLKCQWTNVNEPVAPELFTLAGVGLEPGTRIVDFTTGMPVLQTIIRPESLQAPATRSTRRFVFLLVNVCVLIAILTFAYLRRRFPGANAPP
jgi:hypothetical protein